MNLEKKRSKLINARKTFSLKPRGQNTLMVFANAPTNILGKCQIDFFFRTLNDFSNTSVIEEGWNVSKVKPISIKNPFPPMYYEFFDVKNTPNLCLEAIKIEQNNKELDSYFLSLKDLKAGNVCFKQIIKNKSLVPYKGHLLYRLRNLADSSMLYLGSVDSLLLDKDVVSQKISIEQDLSKLAIKEGTYKLELLAHHQGKELNVWSDGIHPYYFVFKDLDLGEKDTMCRVKLPKMKEGDLSFSEELAIAPNSCEHKFKKGTFVRLKAKTSKNFVLKKVLINGVNIYTEGQDIVFRLDEDTEVETVYEKAWFEVKTVGGRQYRTLVLEGLRDGMAQLGSIVKLKVLDDHEGVFIKTIKVNGEVINSDLSRVEGEQEFLIEVKEATNIEYEFIRANSFDVDVNISGIKYDIYVNGELVVDKSSYEYPYLYENDEVEIRVEEVPFPYELRNMKVGIGYDGVKEVKFQKPSKEIIKFIVGKEDWLHYKIKVNAEIRKDLCFVMLEEDDLTSICLKDRNGVVIENNYIVLGSSVDLVISSAVLINNIEINGKLLFDKPLLKQNYTHRMRIEQDTNIKVVITKIKGISLGAVENGHIEFEGTYRAGGVDYVIEGKDVTINALPDAGYKLENLLLNGVDISNGLKFRGFDHSHYYIEASFTKVSEIEDLSPLKSMLYPNPTKEFLYIEGIYEEARIYSMGGGLLVKYPMGKQDINVLNLSFLKRGAFLLHLKKGNAWEVYKLYKE